MKEKKKIMNKNVKRNSEIKNLKIKYLIQSVLIFPFISFTINLLNNEMFESGIDRLS